MRRSREEGEAAAAVETGVDVVAHGWLVSHRMAIT